MDFREYVTAISMLIEGTTVEKLRWSFKLYDKDKDGSITRSEMLEIMQVSDYSSTLLLDILIWFYHQIEFQMVFVYSILDCSTRGQYIIRIKCCSQAVYKMSVAASLTKPNPLTAEECTNRIFVHLDKDNNGTLLSHCYLKYTKSFRPLLKFKALNCTSANYSLAYRKFSLLMSFFVFPFL